MTNPPPITHEKVQIVMTIKNGQVINTRNVRDNELIASMDTFFWMAKKAGYQVISPEDETEQEHKHMKDNRTASAIDLAFQKYETPVGPLFVAMRHGRMKRCFSRSGAINRLIHFMVQHVFDKYKIPTHEGGYEREVDGVIHFSRGELTSQYWKAYNRTYYRVLRIMARKREIQKWSKKYDAWVAQRDELMKQRPY
ncbi:hypothetical protein [Salmonella enterica]